MNKLQDTQEILGLQYVPAIQDIVVAWGRKGDNLSKALENISGNDTA